MMGTTTTREWRALGRDRVASSARAVVSSRIRAADDDYDRWRRGRAKGSDRRIKDGYEVVREP
ncbi:MAG: hypothetical protein LBM23_09030 [Propionibacteriaceae bacterium]|jgi:hypothetical protein|nr:hypothetical protein [Propionibacteriaceae bacterium]